VYTSESLALAALEYLVKVDPETAPDDLVAIAAFIPDGLEIERVSVDELPKDWRRFPAPTELASRGTKWADRLETAVLQVPSAVVPQESNFLLNPRHPGFAKIVARAPIPFAFDTRFWRKQPSGPRAGLPRRAGRRRRRVRG
jgi:RES domain-containing protein